jgi:hypothetical protein
VTGAAAAGPADGRSDVAGQDQARRPGRRTPTGCRRAARTVSRRARARAGFALALGGAILLLAVPRVVAAFWLWLRAPTMDLVIYQEPVSAADLYGLIASRELALGWVDASASRSEQAAALTVLASLEEPESARERELLERALGATEASLARGPADPRGWTRLAYLRTLLAAAPDPAAARALALSLRTGRYDRPDFLARRLHLILLHWPVMPAAAQSRVGDQIRLIWQEEPEELVGLALEPGLTDRLLAVLADAPAIRSPLLDAMRGVISAK